VCSSDLCLDLSGKNLSDGASAGEKVWQDVRVVLESDAGRQDRGVQGLIGRLQEHLPADAERWRKRLTSLMADSNE